MICAVCGRTSAHRFCSNACFRAHRNASVECAICQYMHETGTVGNPNSTRRCAACAADPANQGWSDKWRRIEFSEDLDSTAARVPYAEVVLPSIGREVSKLQLEIARLWRGWAEEKYRYRDRRGRSRGMRTRRRRLTRREIARHAGCDESYVIRVLKILESG